MKPQWDEQIKKLTSAMGIWRVTLPKLPPVFATAQGINVPTEDLSVALEEIYAILERINISVDIDPILLSIHQQGVLSPLTQITSLISGLSANPSPQILDQIAQNTWSIRASLVWLAAPKLNASNMLEITADLDLDLKLEALKSLVIQYSQEVANSSRLSKEILDSEQKANAALQFIKDQEKAAGDAKASAENSAISAATSKNAIATQLDELSADLDRQPELLTQIDELRDKPPAHWKAVVRSL